VPAPAAVAAKYDASCASMIALLCYGWGLPSYRLQALQAWPLDFGRVPAPPSFAIASRNGNGGRPSTDHNGNGGPPASEPAASSQSAAIASRSRRASSAFT
jgi:hypothetical protein